MSHRMPCALVSSSARDLPFWRTAAHRQGKDVRKLNGTFFAKEGESVLALSCFTGTTVGGFFFGWAFGYKAPLKDIRLLQCHELLSQSVV
jgi:hypothetical protein